MNKPSVNQTNDKNTIKVQKYTRRFNIVEMIINKYKNIETDPESDSGSKVQKGKETQQRGGASGSWRANTLTG